MKNKNNFNKLIEKLVNRETITYLIMGVLTTIVNIIAYHIFCNVLLIENLVANAIAWIIAVLFAYVTNNKYVFRSKFIGKKEELNKIIKFFGARLFSFVIEEIGMYIMIDNMGINNLLVKVIMNVIVIIINYIFSKVFIFKQN